MIAYSRLLATCNTNGAQHLFATHFYRHSHDEGIVLCRRLLNILGSSSGPCEGQLLALADFLLFGGVDNHHTSACVTYSHLLTLA